MLYQDIAYILTPVLTAGILIQILFISLNMDISSYYAKINSYPNLAMEQEQNLFLELQNSETSETRRKEIRQLIINSNLCFAFKQARYFAKTNMEAFEDLISVANEGLLVGLEKYDLSKGVRFLTYAGHWVNQRILDYMAKYRLVTIPTWKQQLLKKITKIRDKNPDVTREELYVLLPKSKPKYIDELYDYAYLTYYIEDLTDESAFIINPIEDEVESKLLSESIQKELGKLTALEQKVVSYLYGFYDGESWTVKAISKELEVSVTEVKQAKENALEKLQGVLSNP